MRSEGPSATRWVAVAAGGLAVLVGGGHVVAWVAGLMPRGPTSAIIMKANAGLGLLASGLAVMLVAAPNQRLRRRRIAQICAAVALLLGLATLSEHVGGWNLGIDQLLATELPGAAATTSPNRMGPPASLSLALLGTALLLLTRRAGAGRRGALHEPFALAAALLGLLSIIGYLYGVSALYDIARLTGIAWPTALSIVLLAVGVLCAEPERGFMSRLTAPDPGGAIIRGLLGPMVLLPLVLGWVRLTGERLGWFDAPMGTGLMMLLFIVTFSALLLFAGRRVSAASAALGASEHEARSQKDLLAVTLASIGDAVIVTNADGAVTFLNGEAERLTGWTSSDAAGKPLPRVLVIVNEKTREGVENPVEKVMRLGRVTALGNHTLLVSKDGREIPIDDSGAPIRTREGEPRGVVLVFRDITERRGAEEERQRFAIAVQEERDRLSALINSMTDEIWFADADKNLTLVNPAVWKEFGTSLGDTSDVEKIAARFEVYRSDGTQRPVEDAPPLRALRGEVVIGEEEILRTPATGEMRYRQVNAAPVRDRDGTIVGSVSVVRDITERKRAGEALAKTTNVLAEGQRIAHVGTFEYVADSRTTVWSEEEYRIYGLDPTGPSPAYAVMLAENIHPDDAALLHNAFTAAMQSGSIFELEHRIVRPDGSVRWVYDRAQPYFDKQGNLERYVGVTQDITDRKHAEEALRVREADLSRAQATAHLGSWRWDLETDRVAWSEEMYRVFGVDPTRFVPSHSAANELIHPADRARHAEFAAMALAGRPVPPFESRIIRPGGEERVVQASGFEVEFDASGKPVRLFGTVLDITDRKNAEKSLRWQDAIQRGIQSVLNAATRCTTEEELGRACLTEAEKLSESKFGFIDEIGAGGELNVIAISDPGWDASRIPLSQRQPPRNMAIRGIYGRVIQDGRSFFTNDPAAHPDRVGLPPGHPPLTAFLGVPLVREGRTIGMIAVGNREGGYSKTQQDALEKLMPAVVEAFTRRRAEAALRESEARFRGIVETAEEGIAVHEADGTIAYVNQRMADMLGYAPSELVGRSSLEFVDDEEKKAVTRAREALSEGHGFNNERRLRRKDGSTLWTLSNVAPRRDSTGNFVGYLAMHTDITGLKETTEALRKANTQLQETDRRKDEFIAILSHELRNPLAPIRYALPALQKAGVTEAGGEAIEVIERQVTHLSRLVDDLLDVSRITTGKIELRCDYVTLRSVVRSAVEAAAPAVATGGHSLNVHVPDEPLWVYGDAARLSQVVTNLLDNSAKYTPSGGQLEVRVSCENGRAAISVRDNGVGIPGDELPTVFEMFHQVIRPGKVHAGLGIGLALVKRLVELHGGTVEAHSAGVGLGAEFVVHLPVAVDVGPDRADIAPVSGGHKRLRVLVVDDNRDLVAMLAVFVESFGHDVRKAFDGPSAMSAAVSYRPDVVLLDVGLPGMTGLDVARELRKRPETSAARLIALTGWGQADDRQATRDAGFDAHLTKPTDPAVLEAVLDCERRSCTGCVDRCVAAGLLNPRPAL